MRKKEKDMRDKWESEKKSKDAINKKKEELERARFELSTAENNYDLETSAKLRHGVIPALEKELQELRSSTKNSILSDVVDEEGIAEIC